MDYTRIAEDMRFLDIMIKEEKEMDSYINECIILSSGNMKAINEMQVLNESKFSGKISSFFTKIQSLFVRIFAKFGEKLSAQGKNNKDYLEKYKNIILGKKLKISYVTMFDHFEGKRRIDEMRNDSSDFGKLPSDDFWTAMKEKIGKNDDTTNKFVAYDIDDKEQLQKDLFDVFLKQVHLDNKIKYNKGDENIGGILKEYFMGSKEEVRFSNSDLQKSMDVIYNALYSYEETFNNIQKFKTSYESALKSIESKYISELNKVIAENNKTNSDIESKVKTERVNYRYNNSIYFNEMEVKMDNSSSPGNSGGSSTGGKFVDKKYNSGVETPGSETSKNKESTMSNKKMDSYTKDNSDSITNQATSNKDDNGEKVTIKGDDGNDKETNYKKMSEKYDVNNYIQNCNDYFSAYQYIRTQTFAAMLTSIESMNNDYKSLIRAHVNSYLGQVNNDSDNTNTKYVNTSDTTRNTPSVPV